MTTIESSKLTIDFEQMAEYRRRAYGFVERIEALLPMFQEVQAFRVEAALLVREIEAAIEAHYDEHTETDARDGTFAVISALAGTWRLHGCLMELHAVADPDDPYVSAAWAGVDPVEIVTGIEGATAASLGYDILKGEERQAN